MRHAPFAIGSAERDAWLAAMRTAVGEAGLAPGHAAQLLGYLEDDGPAHGQPPRLRASDPDGGAPGGAGGTRRGRAASGAGGYRRRLQPMRRRAPGDQAPRWARSEATRQPPGRPSDAGVELRRRKVRPRRPGRRGERAPGPAARGPGRRPTARSRARSARPPPARSRAEQGEQPDRLTPGEQHEGAPSAQAGGQAPGQRAEGSCNGEDWDDRGLKAGRAQTVSPR